MMLKLTVQPYCEDCSAIEPVVKDSPKGLDERIIVCKHREKCKRLVRYLKNHAFGEKIQGGITW